MRIGIGRRVSVGFVSLCVLIGALLVLGFTTAAAAGPSASVLPDTRAYELVSDTGDEGELYVPYPPEHLTADHPTARPFQAAVGGEAVAYVGNPGASGGSGGIGEGLGTEWLATRTSDGWRAKDITPVGSDASAAYQEFSSDLSIGIESNFQQLTPDAPSCRDLYARTSGDGSYHPLFTTATSPGKCGGLVAFAGASADHSQIAFQTQRGLTAGVEDTEEGEFEHAGYEERCDHSCNLYDSAGDQLRLVNVLPNGEAVPNATFGGSSGTRNPPNLSNVLSSDGSRAFWTDTQPGPDQDHIFVRENPSQPESPRGPQGECTIDVDACTIPVSLAGAHYWAATPDGRFVYYTEGEDLWRYDTAGNTREALVHEGLHGEGAGVQGVVGINQIGPDGAYVYFVADAALTPGSEARSCEEVNPREEERSLALGEGCNLYLLQGGGLKLVTTLARSDNNLRGVSFSSNTTFGDWQADLGSRTAQVAPDGRHIAFASTLPLTGYDSGQGREAPAVEAFVYAADTGRLACASCSPSGAAHVSTRGEEPRATILPVSLSDTRMKHWLSDDGSRLFFQTRQSLLPQDNNGDRQDVYEWKREGTPGCPETTPPSRDGGCVFLISGGESSDFSFLVDADAEGDNVFFATRSQLVPQDQDGKMDLYDARVGGGFPEPSLACQGAGCQGVPPAPPLFATPSSTTFTGIGNFPPSGPVTKPKPKQKCKRGFVKRDRKCVKARKRAKRAKKPTRASHRGVR